MNFLFSVTIIFVATQVASNEDRCDQLIVADICKGQRTNALALKALCTRPGFKWGCFAEGPWTGASADLASMAWDMCCNGVQCKAADLFAEICCGEGEEDCNRNCYGNLDRIRGMTYTFTSEREDYCN
uniref:DB domain-containing protein n=1 Tax=Steinernema glaseri TaxID=37863 RepID=A0A1I7YJ71_9BILA